MRNNREPTTVGLRRSRLSSRLLICYEYSSEYLAKLFDDGRLPDRKAQSVHTATFARIRALNHLALLVADDLVQSVFFDRAVRVLFMSAQELGLGSSRSSPTPVRTSWSSMTRAWNSPGISWQEQVFP